MDYLRVIKFSISLFIVLIIASTTLTMGFLNDINQINESFWVKQYILSSVISLTAYALFTRNQNNQPYKHAALAAVIYWILNLTATWLMNLILTVQIVSETILLELLISAVIVPLGAFIGVKSRVIFSNHPDFIR